MPRSVCWHGRLFHVIPMTFSLLFFSFLPFFSRDETQQQTLQTPCLLVSPHPHSIPPPTAPPIHVPLVSQGVQQVNQLILPPPPPPNSPAPPDTQCSPLLPLTEISLLCHIPLLPLPPHLHRHPLSSPLTHPIPTPAVACFCEAIKWK